MAKQFLGINYDQTAFDVADSLVGAVGMPIVKGLASKLVQWRTNANQIRTFFCGQFTKALEAKKYDEKGVLQNTDGRKLLSLR